MDGNEVEIVDAGVPQTREAESQVPLGIQSLQIARQRAALVTECRKLAVDQTDSEDWIDYGGKPGVGIGGAEKIRLLFGLQAYDLKVTREDKSDSKGEFYMYAVTGRIGNASEQMDIIGSQTSRKAFYSRSNNTDIESCDVNEGNVRKDAVSNWWTSAVSRFLGLRGMSWEKLAAMSGGQISKDNANKVDFKSGKAARTDADTDKATKTWKWLLEMNAQSVQAAKNQLKTLTLFGQNTDKPFNGYTDINKVSQKVLPRLYGTVKGLHEKFGGDAPGNANVQEPAGKDLVTLVEELTEGIKNIGDDGWETISAELKLPKGSIETWPVAKLEAAIKRINQELDNA